MKSYAVEEQTAMCGQLCTRPIVASLVWPGQGRVFYCAGHLEKCKDLASKAGLDENALDIQPVRT